MTRLVLIVSVAVLAAVGLPATVGCGGGGGGGGGGGPDAKVFKDAPASGATVMSVSCTGATISATFTETDGVNAFNPTSATITQGQIAKFVTSSSHSVAPNSTGSDPGLACTFNSTCCLMFTHSGTFGFHCNPHGFMATITVN